MGWCIPIPGGTPMSLLRWMLKSTYELARHLQERGYRMSAELVRRLLHQRATRCRHQRSRRRPRPIRIMTASPLSQRSARPLVQPSATLPAPHPWKVARTMRDRPALIVNAFEHGINNGRAEGSTPTNDCLCDGTTACTPPPPPPPSPADRPRLLCPTKTDLLRLCHDAHTVVRGPRASDIHVREVVRR
jgi:Rhodopirellula transposase DDE domain